ncbi:Arylsulfatase [Anaerohalosphaera lusitana]|uniref:Arylsulfatase n=1 Tax=Anaerohalosphaera lusitana TaxID=1936003 RepID=A0A1U9NLQ4_9BACT|nr:sulfatase-like hydrolase/transferase [Anaerohalosphaera lusitana]AQT68839.1 Arylsulfatase [Anaerohalosphaera lusitana]
MGISRRNFLKNVGMSLAACTLTGTAARALGEEPKKNTKPNVLFIFADDQTYECVRALGNDEIKTPNLDRLVNEGTTFTHAYNMGAWHGAVCVASRTMLNTGRHLWDAREKEKSLNSEAEKGHFWSQYMQRAGYDTYFSGKWHVKTDVNQLFDTVSHVRPGMPRSVNQAYNRPVEGEEDKWKPWDKKFGGYWQGGKHWSEVLGDDGVKFLDKAAEKEDPFFMYLAFNAPHDPRQSPKEYVDKYPLLDVKLPENFLPEYPHKDAMGCGKWLRDEKLAPFPRTEYSVKVHRQEYYAIIDHMDAQVGRILDKLEETGQKDNTYIFFTADHGLSCGHHGLMGKQNMYDHSVRVPLMVVGPGIPASKKLETPVYLQDIMPTTLELAGVEKPEQVAFNSLLPLVSGEKKSSYDAVYGGYMNLQRMITKDGFKMILYPKISKVLLFDLESDPLETTNLADMEKYGKTVAKLSKSMAKLQKSMQDPLDLSEAYSELFTPRTQ